MMELKIINIRTHEIKSFGSKEGATNFISDQQDKWKEFKNE